MTIFTQAEIAYLRRQRVGRLATADAHGRPHVVPTRYHVDARSEVIEIGAYDLPDRGQTRQYHKNIQVNPYVAFVVDDLMSGSPWRPRAVLIRGRAELKLEGGERLGPGFGPRWVKIRPIRVRAWGIELERSRKARS